MDPKEQPAKPTTPAAPKTPKAPKPEAPKGPKVGDAAPEIIGKDASGKEMKLSDLKGNVVVIDFWATWCPPCRAAMPEIQKLHEKFQGKNVKVIGVAVWERPHTPAKEGETKPERVYNGKPFEYMKAMKFTYSCWAEGDDSAKKYGVTGIPSMWVIDADGKIIAHETGFDPSKGLKEIEAAVSKAAKDAKAAAPSSKTGA
ncbi:MAG: TlpA family protein disulfide reductase [Phycisphaeraceae bacterium]|nr:TlpA family protein disulfide reductase [Phycisphaeraceae bacterium]